MTGLRCAAADCDNPVLRHPGQVGRPPIYCSPTCRVSRAGPSLAVEVDQLDDDEDDHGRDWVVRVRRGRRVVVVGRGLGRFSASALATELGSVLGAAVSERR